MPKGKGKTMFESIILANYSAPEIDATVTRVAYEAWREEMCALEELTAGAWGAGVSEGN